MDHVVYIAVLHISIMMFLSALFFAFWFYFYLAYEAISASQLIGYYVLWAICGTNFFLLGPIAIVLLTKEIRIKCMTRTTLSLYVLLCLASIAPTPLLSNVFGKGEATRTYVRDFYFENGRVPYLMDYIQRYQRCCGHNNYTDYYRNPEDLEEDDEMLNEALPLSCCSEIMLGCEKSFGLTYKQGCFIMPGTNSPVMAWEHPFHGTGFLVVVLIPLVLPLFQFLQMCFLHDAFSQVYQRRNSRRWCYINEGDQESTETGAGDATKVQLPYNSKSASAGSSSSSKSRSSSSSSSRLASVTSVVFPLIRNREIAHARPQNSWNSMFKNMNPDNESLQSKDISEDSSSWSSETSASKESFQTYYASEQQRRNKYHYNDRRSYSRSINRSGRRKEYTCLPQARRYYVDDSKDTDYYPTRRMHPLKSQGNDDKTAAVVPINIVSKKETSEYISTAPKPTPDTKSKTTPRSKRKSDMGKASSKASFKRRMLVDEEVSESSDEETSNTDSSVASLSILREPDSIKVLVPNAGGIKVKNNKDQTTSTVILEPTAQHPIAQNPIAQNPIAQNPIAQNPIAQNPIAQNPIAQNPIAQNPIAQNPIAQNPIAQNPIAQNPIAQNPIAQNPIAQNPIVQNPIAQNPAAQKPTNEGKGEINSRSKEESGTTEKRNDDQSKSSDTENLKSIIKHLESEVDVTYEYVKALSRQPEPIGRPHHPGRFSFDTHKHGGDYRETHHGNHQDAHRSTHHEPHYHQEINEHGHHKQHEHHRESFGHGHHPENEHGNRRESHEHGHHPEQRHHHETHGRDHHERKKSNHHYTHDHEHERNHHHHDTRGHDHHEETRHHDHDTHEHHHHEQTHHHDHDTHEHHHEQRHHHDTHGHDHHGNHRKSR